MVFSFIIIAALIFTVFRILNFILGRVKNKLKMKYHLNDILMAIELVTTILFVLWVVKVIYDSKNYFALISISVFFILLIVPFFFLIRDYIIGVSLKLQNKLIEGKYVDVDCVKGIVKKTGHFRFDIEDKHGNVFSLPYYKVRSKIILRSETNQNLIKAIIEFQFNETEKVNELIDKLKREIMNTPWVAVSQHLIIENTKHENGKLLIEVGVFMLDKSYAEDIKLSVMSYLIDK